MAHLGMSTIAVRVLYLSVYVNTLISFVTPGGRYHVSQSEIQSAISKEPQGIQL